MIIDLKNLDQSKPGQDKTEKWTPVTYYARTAAVVGICIFAAGVVLILAALVLYYFSDQFQIVIAWRFVAIGLVCTITMAIVSAAVLGIRWTAANVARIWDLENFKTYGPAISPELETPAMAPPVQPIKGPDIGTAVWTLTAAHYVDNLKTTRRAAADNLDIGPDIWNRANKIILALGLKTGQKWTAANMDSAAGIIRRRLSSIAPDGSHAWIKENQNMVRIDLDPQNGD